MIPQRIMNKLNIKEEALIFGSLSLKIVKHDGKKVRYLWVEKTSEIEGSPSSGECALVNTSQCNRKQPTIRKRNE